ncbi:MAG TPA: LysR family transcriptional regulator [Bradyrhizobium sp.]|nr:LysR family transcriptional regulator [Bradyrhizobium sp.]
MGHGRHDFQDYVLTDSIGVAYASAPRPLPRRDRRSGNFTRGEALHVSQPTLSQQIRQLEDTLPAPHSFWRTTDGLALEEGVHHRGEKEPTAG